MQGLGPLTRRSVVDETTEMLRARILHGAWQPGEKIPTEAELTKVLGVSRSTVREALNRLASAGLVHFPHGGTKVVLDFRDHAGLEVLSELTISPDGQIAVDVVRSAVEMRAALAPDVARLAAIRRTPEQHRELDALVAQMTETDGLEALLPLSLDWWSTLVLASRNLAYRLAFNTLLSTAPETRPMLRTVLEPELLALERYRAVTDAVSASDPLAAEQACRELVGLGTDAILTALEHL